MSVSLFVLMHLPSFSSFIAFSSFSGDISGQVYAMLTLTVAAAEAAIGLAILVVFFRNLGSIEVSKINNLKIPKKEIQDYINSSKDFTENPGQENFVRVTELGSSSIDLTILCYMSVIDYTQFSQVKQELIFNIMSAVENHNSDFAFPSLSLIHI